MDKMKDLILLGTIVDKSRENPTNTKYYEDCFILCYNKLSENKELGLAFTKMLKSHIDEMIRSCVDMVSYLIDLKNNVLKLESPYLFDSYMQYLEHNRRPSEKFYLPRREQLKEVVQAFQDLDDGYLDELFFSCPPRVGKTSLVAFFITWVIGKKPEGTNLYSAYSSAIINAFYDGILEIIDDTTTYAWKEIFPNAIKESNSAEYKTINIGRKKRYPSLTCRSLYGTLNGACDCNNYLIGDDLIGSIEEALNPDRLNSAWLKVTNNLLTRAKEGAKIIWVGTRWSLYDPIGRRLALVQTKAFESKRYKIVNLPALNKKGESNFMYKYNVGFTKDKYYQIRSQFEKSGDEASWLAQYMCEPIERSGALFSPGDMNFFNGILPDKEPDRVFIAVDVAFGGGDYLSAPVAYAYTNEKNKEDIYIVDWLFSDGDKKVTQPLLALMIVKHKVQAVQFEKNTGGVGYKDDIQELLLTEYGYKCNLTTRYSTSIKSKEIRIFDKAPEIREFMFLEDGMRSLDYSLAMNNLYSFKLNGKNRHDDAPDSLAMLVEMKNDVFGEKFEVFARPF